VKIIKLLFIICFFLIPILTFGQRTEEEILDSLATKKKLFENPVYKPVIGLGYGVMNFYGEVHDNLRSPLMGTPAYKLNVATFLDKKHMFKTNFFMIIGTLTGNEHYVTSDTTRNWNFQSDIFTMGLNIHYDFGHFIKFNKTNWIRPFISIGFENIQFNSKTDLYYNVRKNNSSEMITYPYHYWSDGTIRDVVQNQLGIGNIVGRDYVYETDLRDRNRNGLGSYPQNTFGIPLEVGIDFKISERVNLRLGSSWHYTFTDNIDDVSPRGTVRKGDKWNDIFSFNYFSLHMDLFSDPTEIKVKDYAADVTDLMGDVFMAEDEDGDGVFDWYDKCPGTPFGMGVVVDADGCPVDTDKDGVSDYLDKEPNTPPGAIVDDNGVQIKPEDYAAKLSIEGINRKDVEAFLTMHKAQSRMKGRSSVPIPPKFKSVDTDGDNYISFDELVKTINDFFDSPTTTFSTKDIYELQDFFFEQ
jgi:hypothetical protein